MKYQKTNKFTKMVNIQFLMNKMIISNKFLKVKQIRIINLYNLYHNHSEDQVYQYKMIK